MTKEEFGKIIEDSATTYAIGAIVDPEEHWDAIEAVAVDYIEGAIKAYELLTGTIYE